MICICTSIWTHHQAPVARELARILGDDNFRLLLHQPLDHHYSLDRIRMGWNLVPPDEPWIIGPPKWCADADYTEYVRIVMSANAIIFSSDTPYLTQAMLEERNRAGKLNFRMGERFFKVARPWYWRFWPRKWLARFIVGRRYRKAGLHFLTMGHWCAEDLKYYGAQDGRIWRWGYLTSVSKEYCEKSAHDKVRIGWCGRMLDWKRVDYIITAFSILSPEVRAKCELTLIGNGDQEECLKTMVREKGLNDIITFKDSMPSSSVLQFMRGLDIYVFPSDRYEGWGAALLEAMDNGCAVIANTSAGATLEVVEDGVNGFAFNDGDVATLADRLEWLVEHASERQEFGRKAWMTIQKWSPQEGAERLVGLIEALQSGKTPNGIFNGLCEKVR